MKAQSVPSISIPDVETISIEDYLESFKEDYMKDFMKERVNINSDKYKLLQITSDVLAMVVDRCNELVECKHCKNEIIEPIEHVMMFLGYIVSRMQSEDKAVHF